MKPIFYLLAINLFFFSSINSAKENSNQPPTSFSIKSKKLNSIITIEIALPEGYNENSNKKYNSIYLLDANYYFDENEGTLDFLLQRGDGMKNIVKRLTENGDIPPSILIGIKYSEHQRGLFTMSNVDKFYEFFSEELIPKIDSVFRAKKSANDRLLFGYSGSAHFSTYALMSDVKQKKQTFNKFISISGVYNKNTQTYKLEEELAQTKNNKLFKGKSLFIAIGDSDPKTELLNAHREFSEKFSARNYTRFKLLNTEFEGRGHYDVPEFAFEEALKWIYK